MDSIHDAGYAFAIQIMSSERLSSTTREWIRLSGVAHVRHKLRFCCRWKLLFLQRSCSSSSLIWTTLSTLSATIWKRCFTRSDSSAKLFVLIIHFAKRFVSSFAGCLTRRGLSLECDLFTAKMRGQAQFADFPWPNFFCLSIKSNALDRRDPEAQEDKIDKPPPLT